MKLKLFLLFISLITLKYNNLVGQTNRYIDSIRIGKFVVYKLQEAEFYVPSSVLKPINKDKMPLLAANLDSVHAPANSFLIKSPNNIILVDAGIGDYSSNPEKNLMTLIKSIGVEPNQVDMILITHFHFDHISGLIDSLGNESFPNASIYVSQKENDYWFNNPNQLLEKHKKRAKMVPNYFVPYMNANKYYTFNDYEFIAEGIQAIPAYGHTMGHTIFSFESSNQTLWCIGDLMHIKKIQFDHPRLGITYDSKPETAVESRMKLFEQAAKKRVYIAASHDFDYFKIKINGEKIVEIPLTYLIL
ncbi:MAG: hypothetical protein C0597_09620 [Marinilabiliales bacterium]|nr:MAG: hypothetical protein C0597_09620 [Marinilabiliales bacterium]